MPGAIIGLLGFLIPSISSLAGEAGIITALIALITMVIRIYFWATAAMVAFFALCAVFAKDIIAWFLSAYFWLVDKALASAGMPTGAQTIEQIIHNLPPEIMEILARIHVFDDIHFLVTCWFINKSLSSIPLVGRLFRS